MQTDTHKALCKLLNGDYRHESSIQLVRRVEGLVHALRKERDDAATNALAFRTELNEFMTDELLDRLGLEDGYTPKQFHKAMKTLFVEQAVTEASKTLLRKERDEMKGTFNGLKHLVELPESAGLTELSEAVDIGYEQLPKLVEELLARPDTPQPQLSEYDKGMRKAMQRIAVACGKKFAVDIGYEQLPELVEELLARPDTAQPQLSETRYVLHGDIQPCSVLYSDDTTTLLRLDEGDIMCETDTIEWSDEMTYRCQELLRGEAKRCGDIITITYIKLLAQLVRDERITLNDDAELGVDEAYFRISCTTCGHLFDEDDTTCPMCMNDRATTA